MPTRLWDYAFTVLGYWQFLVAVLLMIGRTTERLKPTLFAWADNYFSVDWRRRIFIWAAIGAFLWANFRAFDDAQSRAIQMAGERNAAISQRDAANSLAADRQREIDRLNLRIAALEAQRPAQPIAPPRNPDGLYQLDIEVGTVGPAYIDLGHSTVTFQGVRSLGNLDPTKEVEFRDFVLQCDGLPMAPRGFSGSVSSVSTGARCDIVRRR